MNEELLSDQTTESVASTAPDNSATQDDPATDVLVEEISIDGMCGVY